MHGVRMAAHAHIDLDSGVENRSFRILWNCPKISFLLILDFVLIQFHLPVYFAFPMAVNIRSSMCLWLSLRLEPMPHPRTAQSLEHLLPNCSRCEHGTQVHFMEQPMNNHNSISVEP